MGKQIVKDTSEPKRFMVTSTENRHSAFIEACSYLNLDMNSIIEQQMLRVCREALKQAEMQNSGNLDIDDARNMLAETFGEDVENAFWNPKFGSHANSVLHGVG